MMRVPIPTFRPAATAIEELEQKHAIVSAWLANIREDLTALQASERTLRNLLATMATLQLGERNLCEVLATLEASIRALN